MASAEPVGNLDADLVTTPATTTERSIWALGLSTVVALAILMVAARNETIAKTVQYGLIVGIVVVILANTDDAMRLLNSVSKGVTGEVKSAGDNKK